ncbi:MBL fold metallo-hydrolase [Streptomyces sp. NPDC012769]|uniref:MBL fold metallo-hydrolase n=1 Tax=Streptomyces sp. NPDC012769 TaxID=3364848 RepID=UPI00368E8270
MTGSAAGPAAGAASPAAGGPRMTGSAAVPAAGLAAGPAAVPTAGGLPVTATYIGTATVLLRIGELTILTDPAFDAAPADYPAARPLHRTAGPALTADRLPPIDLVLLSHDQHADNLDRTGREVLARAAHVLTTPEAAGRLGGRAEGLASWESRTFTARFTAAPDRMGAATGGTGAADPATATDRLGATVTVTATPARHGPEGTEQATGPVTGFVVQYPGGSLYLSGDTVRHDALKEIAERFPSLDVAFLHFGDAHFPSTGDLAFSLSATEGAALARTLGARTVIPLHFDSWTHLAEDPNRITAAFAADPALAGRLRRLRPGLPERLA